MAVGFLGFFGIGFAKIGNRKLAFSVFLVSFGIGFLALVIWPTFETGNWFFAHDFRARIVMICYLIYSYMVH